jgi:hypothetical protein
VPPESLPCKGDCLLCYNAEESVKLAVDILSGGYISANHQVTVTRADFTPGGNGDQGGAARNGGHHQGQAHRPSLSQAQVRADSFSLRSCISHLFSWSIRWPQHVLVFKCKP